MKVVQQAVQSLDNLEEEFSPVLVHLGSIHPIRADFSPDKMAAFVQSVLDIWSKLLDDKMAPECAIAWETLFYYFLVKLKQGYHEKHSEKTSTCQNSIKEPL